MIFRWLLGKICMVSEKLYRNILNTTRLRTDFWKGLAHSSKLMHQRWKQVKVLKQTFHISGVIIIFIVFVRWYQLSCLL